MATEKIPGYNGKILRVNLSNSTVTTEDLNAAFCRKYLGGAGFVAYYMLKEVPAKIDALGPENKLIFATGPFTGLKLPGSGRNCVGAKSPLTNTIAKAESGGFWGPEFKYAGFDALIIEGKAATPVYLWITDGQVVIRDAAGLWGKNTKETEAAIRAELGDEHVEVAMIGPGGENLVRYACIMHGLHDAAGRGGLGAVMGSKNLKAVAVRGHNPPELAKPDAVKDLREWMLGNMAAMKWVSEYGTGTGMKAQEVSGNLPIRNFRDGVFPAAEKIQAEAIASTMRIKMEGCFACPVRCKKVVKVDGPPYSVDSAYGGPEYETLAALGSNCGVDDLKAIAKANELCAAYSLDTISTGGTIAFAMECFENGLLTLKDTGGMDLHFGNADSMVKLVELIARKQGIGALLAEGSLRAAKKIGGKAEELAMQSKGLEAGLHEPRLKAGTGLGYMVSPIGADHCLNLNDSGYVTERKMGEFHRFGVFEPLPSDDIGPKKVVLFKLAQLKRLLTDTLSYCLFLPYSYEQIADLTAAVTGWDTGVMEQVRVAERILTAMRLYNIREGFTRDDDDLPARFFQPKTDGFLAKAKPDHAKFEEAKSYYYLLMGWDPHTGVPLPQRVEELGI